MNIIAYLIVSVSLLCAMIVLSVKNVRYKELADRKTRTVPLFLLACILLVSADLTAGGGDMPLRLSWDLMLCMIPVMFLTSSLWKREQAEVILRVCGAATVLTAAYYLAVAFSLLEMLPSVWSAGGVMLLALSVAGLFIYGLWRHIRDVRAVMKNGTVWFNVSLGTEALYSIVVLMHVLVFLFVSSAAGTYSGVHSLILTVLLVATVCALAARVAFDSVFVFMHVHERRIVESMKMTQVEVVPDTSRIEEQYKDIFERVTEYFEVHKPYLNGELTINDVVKVVYTNKLYISRAISQFTGRNFCQFVNYYRVMYSMELFRSSPELKIHELANFSGFNSVVSFNMAFRLFMGEIPSEWCRRERGKLLRKKK
ncbi:MAG: helix-turn-helix transcriptional regulator [Bacteroidales bacterium]|nr:helix-turn-helix transcriptional regulator [Bacteroidales bacterium]